MCRSEGSVNVIKTWIVTYICDFPSTYRWIFYIIYNWGISLKHTHTHMIQGRYADTVMCILTVWKQVTIIKYRKPVKT